jgi:hypothetical protein
VINYQDERYYYRVCKYINQMKNMYKEYMTNALNCGWEHLYSVYNKEYTELCHLLEDTERIIIKLNEDAEEDKGEIKDVR